MTASAEPGLSGVAETLLVTLYLRAEESRRPDALIKDEKAVELVSRLDYDFGRVRAIPLSEVNKLVIILRNLEFDRCARGFLARHPESILVHIGCGLDSRFERVDDGQVEWYDLDLPQVVDLRRTLLGGEKERYHLLAGSVLDDAWSEALGARRPRSFLFLAEGVFMYFRETQVKLLVQRLRDRFPGAELVFDAYSPIHVWRSNLQIAGFGQRVHWGIWRGQEIEGWGDGIRMLGEWSPFDDPSPRLGRIRWLRPVEALARTMRVYHFRLAEDKS